MDTSIWKSVEVDGKTVDLVRMKVGDLGFSDGFARGFDVIARARELGITPCPVGTVATFMSEILRTDGRDGSDSFYVIEEDSRNSITTDWGDRRYLPSVIFIDPWYERSGDIGLVLLVNLEADVVFCK